MPSAAQAHRSSRSRTAGSSAGVQSGGSPREPDSPRVAISTYPHARARQQSERTARTKGLVVGMRQDSK